MSFEGYKQCICKSGHYYDTGNVYSHRKAICPICFEEEAWCNYVDQTNGNNYGIIFERNMNALIIMPEISQTCNLGHKHIQSPALYRIPKSGEMDEFRNFEDYDEGSFY